MPKLRIIANPDKNASILQVIKGKPVMRGTEKENLLCGMCEAILVRGMSLATVRARTAAPAQLLIQCECGAHNHLSSGIAN